MLSPCLWYIFRNDRHLPENVGNVRKDGSSCIQSSGCDRGGPQKDLFHLSYPYRVFNQPTQPRSCRPRCRLGRIDTSTIDLPKSFLTTSMSFGHICVRSVT